VPSFGELNIMVGAKLVTSELGSGGEFYLDGLAPGRYSGLVDYAQGSCSLQLIVPRAKAGLDNIGSIGCDPTVVSRRVQ
jgi:hypothetical protein